MNTTKLVARKGILVVLSGGLDSALVLAWAKRQQVAVYAVGFDYGQRNVVELDYATRLCAKWGVPFKLVQLGTIFQQVTESPYLKKTGTLDVLDNHQREGWYVPNRNAILLGLAHAWAQKLDCGLLATGLMAEGGLDATREFTDLLLHALNVGANGSIQIENPVQNQTKAKIYAQAESWGVLREMVEDTLSCYEGVDTQHEWGRGCATCWTCAGRIYGWQQWKGPQ